jgi:hypothetical protein
MIDIRTYAWRAVRQLERTNIHRPTIATLAVNLTCTVLGAEVDESHLSEVRTAVDWALDHKDAASLPAGTVVATADTVYIKDGHDPDHPWREATCGSMYANVTRDSEIDEALTDGTAEVLRIGTGKDTL